MNVLIVYCKLFDTYLSIYFAEKLQQRSVKTKHDRISEARALTGASRSWPRRGVRAGERTSFTRRSRVLFCGCVGDSHYPLTPITLFSSTVVQEHTYINKQVNKRTRLSLPLENDLYYLKSILYRLMCSYFISQR